jgi:hypothetical protein
MIFLHADKSSETFLNNFKAAIAQAGVKPTILRTDGAKEYHADKVSTFCKEQLIFQQTTNPYEQFGNCIVENMVNTVGKGTRAALHSSNLPFKYWGYAAVNFVDIYNTLLHSSLDN